MSIQADVDFTSRRRLTLFHSNEVRVLLNKGGVIILLSPAVATDSGVEELVSAVWVQDLALAVLILSRLGTHLDVAMGVHAMRAQHQRLLV